MTTTYRMRGAQSPAQKQYIEYLQTRRWRVIRAARVAIDGGKCRTCHGTHALQVHHADYENRGRGGLMGMVRECRGMITLCAPCHGKLHR